MDIENCTRDDSRLSFATNNSRYNLVDKCSGERVGILTLIQGQDVPDLNSVEVKRIEAKTNPSQLDKSKIANNHRDFSNTEVNGNGIDTLVQRFVGQLENNNHLSLDIDKAGLGAKLEALICGEIIPNVKSDKVKPDATMFLKPFKLGWLRRVSMKCPPRASTGIIYDVWYVAPPDRRDGTRRELRGRNEIEDYLKETALEGLKVDDFFTEKEILGLPTAWESVLRLKESSYSSDDFKKPFTEGWLRTVAIRNTDLSVTSVMYFTPPDSDGKRLRFGCKKYISEYLERTRNITLEIGDFVISRKVIGASANHELIKSSHGQPFNVEDYSEGLEGIKNRDEDSDSQPKNETGLSFDTIVGTSDEVDSSDSSCESDSSIEFSGETVPMNANHRKKMSPDNYATDMSPNLTMESTASSASSQALKPKSEVLSYLSTTPIRKSDSCPASNNIFPAASESYSKLPETFTPAAVTCAPSLEASLAHDRSPLTDTPPCASSSLLPVEPVSTVTVRMVSTKTRAEESKIEQRMMIKCGVKIIKGMRAFARKFKQDFRCLTFYDNIGNMLTGEEYVDNLDRACIMVDGMV